jgi:glycerophosphoryl diester phosphodiesterase
MLIVSHRGQTEAGRSDAVPENTLEAFQRAAALGVDGIETDIRLSADGCAVLYHDRLTSDGREVATLTHAELCSVSGVQVPTLAEAFAALPDLFWLLEVKTPDAVDAVVEFLRARPASSYLVISFWHAVVERIVSQVRVRGGVTISHCPTESILPTLTSTPRSPVASLKNTAHNRIRSLVWNWEFLDPAVVSRFAERGWMNLAYGVVTPEDHRRCLEVGVDTCITDFPEILLAPGATGSAGGVLATGP